LVGCLKVSGYIVRGMAIAEMMSAGVEFETVEGMHGETICHPSHFDLRYKLN